MVSFVGWAPTITGRVAFSRVGNEVSNHPHICNQTEGDGGFLFGKDLKTSPDGPLPPAILRWFRNPDQNFAVFLEVQTAPLPRGKGEKTEMFNDARGRLYGKLYFFSKSSRSKQSGADAAIDEIGELARKARSPRANTHQRRQLFEQARDKAELLFDEMSARCKAGKPTPAFARATVDLNRTGRCQIDVGPGDLYVNRETKLAHRAGEGTSEWLAAEAGFRRAASFISRHVFNVVRGLSHKHYHHHHHADLLATTYEWSLADDKSWRRETQYGLARMAIEIRRRGTAKAFKQCAGVVAYAEAFQLHLGGWSLDPNGKIDTTDAVPPYDFAALRSSVDASLKVRELEDAERRQTILYLTTIFLASLTLAVGGVRALRVPQDSAFSAFLDWVTIHPLLTVAASLFVAWWIDLSLLRAALPPPITREAYYGLKRAAAAVMGSFMWRGLPNWASYAATLVLLLIVAAICGGISFLAFFVLYRQIG